MTRLPTGCVAVDGPLGGGLQIGRLTEIVGPSQSGKTQLAWRALCGVASRGRLALLVDLTATWRTSASLVEAPLILRPPADRPLWHGLRAVLQRIPFGLLVLDAVDVLPSPPWQAPGCLALLRAAAAVDCALLSTCEGGGPRARAVAGCDTPLAAYSSERLIFCAP